MKLKKKILVVTQEIQPYIESTIAATVLSDMLQYLNSKGLELRVLMPRFNDINERRHKLHEVVRLSGINIIINEDDYPLLIKVASLPSSRIQAYFLDNEDFFKRKNMFKTDDGEIYPDNEDRSIFFCKGVMDTVRKFGWSPDIVHCHGFMSALVPAYIKTAFKTDPIFSHSKVIYSYYAQDFEQSYPDSFAPKANLKKMKPKDLDPFKPFSLHQMHKGAIHYSDYIVNHSPNQNTEIDELLNTLTNKPIFTVESPETTQDTFIALYNKILGI